MKILINNYATYEYKLLQEKLDHLTSLGYYPKSMGHITFFYKEESKDHLIVDVFKAKSRDYEQKMREQQAFLDPYIDAGYNVLYTSKNGIYVLYGEDKPPKRYVETHDVNIKKSSYRYLLYFVLILIALVFFSMTMSDGLPFTSMLSCGSCLMPMSLILLLFAFLYYSYKTFLGNFRFERNKLNIPDTKDRIQHILTHVLIVISAMLITGCIIEDFTNTRNTTIKAHPVVTESVLNIETVNVSQKYTVNHGLIVNSYYHYYVKNKDTYILDVKEYDFKDSNDYYNDITESPSLIGCDEIIDKDQYDLGIYNKQKNIILIHDDTKIIVVNVMKDITDKEINAVLEFYNI